MAFLLCAQGTEMWFETVFVTLLGSDSTLSVEREKSASISVSSGLLCLDCASYETNFMAPFLQIIHVSWAPPFNINDADSASTQPPEERCSV